MLAPLQDIFSARPLAAIRPRARNPSRGRYFQLAGALCLVLTIIILFASPDEALIGVVSLTVALMLLLPGLIRGVLPDLGPPLGPPSIRRQPQTAGTPIRPKPDRRAKFTTSRK